MAAPNPVAQIDALIERHRAFAAELDLDPDKTLAERIQVLRALGNDARAVERTLDWQAEMLAQGELLSSTLGAAYLQASGLDFGWCDARDWLDAITLPNQNAWSSRLSVNCRHDARRNQRAQTAGHPQRMLLTQGFIARHADGGTAILGRGGSDTSAAYFGALLNAKRVEIWTDVPGMFSANPREVPDARLLARLDYAEAQEIATTGAKVLHPRSIGPCRAPACRWPSSTPSARTCPARASTASVATVPGVKAISRRNGIVLVSMESIGMWQQVGFLADIFERFKRHGLSVDLIGSSETNVTVSLDPSDNLVNSNVLEALSADLAEVCRVKVIAPCAAITLVGRGMRSLLHRLSDIWADVRSRTRAPDLAVVQRPQPHVRGRRSGRRRPDPAAARRAHPQRRHAGAGQRGVRTQLARDRPRPQAARDAVVAGAAASLAATGRARPAGLRLRPGHDPRAGARRCARSPRSTGISMR